MEILNFCMKVRKKVEDKQNAVMCAYSFGASSECHEKN